MDEGILSKNIIQEQIESDKNREIESISPIRNLVLSGIKLSSQVLNLLPMIEKSEFLIRLDLSFNQFKVQQIEQILLSILSSKHIRFLNLSHNNLNSEKCIEILSELVEQSWNLSELDVSYSQMTKPMEIVRAAQNSCSLQALHMDGLLSSSHHLEIARSILSVTPSLIQNVKQDLGHQSTTFRRSLLLHRSPNKSPEGKRDNGRIMLMKVMDNVNDGCVFQRYIGHPEIQLFENANRFSSWSIPEEKIVKKMFDSDAWPKWREKDICRENQRYCVVLYYSDLNTTQVRIQYENVKHTMIPVAFFLKIIGINCSSISHGWLKCFHDYFSKHRPFYVYNHESTDS